MWKSFTQNLGFARQGRPDLQSLEKVLHSGEFRVNRFERGEIVRPFEEGVDITHAMDAAVVHLSGASVRDKVRLATALHFMRVYGDDNGVFLDILES